jgi:hypothetical protein
MPDNPNSAEPGKPRRRWFLFRLRTLLIVVALLAIPCGYVGWQVKMVRERTACRERMKDFVGFNAFPNPYATSLPPQPQVSSIRRLMGDEGVRTIFLLHEVDSDEIQATFPEANVVTLADLAR